MPLVPVRSLMLDITDAASRGVIIGERGHILVSESRSDWRQVEGVPTRSTLTAVAAVGDKVWAVGHEGTILHSADGGLTWSVQREEHKPSDAELDDPDFEFDPRRGAPLLDVMFVDGDRGFAIGAFSLMLHTSDGGAHWERVSVTGANKEETDEPAAQGGDEWTFDESDLALEEESDPHLNGIARDEKGLLVAVGERGAAFRSRDDGKTWERLQLPYGGSMFGVLALGPGHFLAYGLRGHVLETRDAGSSWVELDTSTELSLMGGAVVPDSQGGVVLVGANGVVLYRPDANTPLGRSTFVNQNQETPVLAAVWPIGARTFLVVGERGIGRHEVPAN